VLHLITTPHYYSLPHSIFSHYARQSFSDVSHSVRLATSSSLTSPREDNTQDNDHQPTVPLGLKLTGYRLLTTVVILGVGIAKSVYQGQALISTSLDWLGGVIFALM
jgi:hypothetical protein